jgi:hypothetical protein
MEHEETEDKAAGTECIRTQDDTPPTRATILERRLTWFFFMWPAALLAVRMVAVYANRGKVLHSLWLYESGTLLSPLVAAVLLVVALSHRPIFHRFLKVVCAFSLFLMILTNHTSATLASGGGFFQAWRQDYNSWEFVPLTNQLTGLLSKYVTLPAFLGPLTDHSMPLSLLYMVVQLLMFIAPPFLALPIFWLWVVLSVLYVVLPQETCGWVKDTVARGWFAVQHGRAP